MYTIAVLSQKGGAGKTTLAINLAGAAEAAGQRTVIIDLDPQASAKAWHDQREDKESPIVISAHAVRLPEILGTATEMGADLCLIDTAPHATDAALQAARAADLVLIPCRPSYIDLRAVATSVDLVRIAQRSALFVLSCVRPGDKTLPDGAEDALGIYSIPVAPVRITLRSDCVHAFTVGKTIAEFQPDGAAALEVRALFVLACKLDQKLTSELDKEIV
jgi:chromosome partitioning protein